MPSSKSLLYCNDLKGTHPPSYYAMSRTPFDALSKFEGHGTYDVAVIGGGYTGLSAALHLCELGFSVCLLEAHRIGWGASGRNGGQVSSGQRVDQYELERLVGHELATVAFEIGVDAADLVRSLIDRHKIECGYKPGVLHVNHKQRFDDHERRYASHLNEYYNYPSAHYLSPDQVAEEIGACGMSGGILDTAAGHLHPLNFALGLAEAAQNAGANLYEMSAVTALETGNKVIVRTADGEVTAKFAILATNGYLEGLEPEVARSVMPINNFIVATEPLQPDFAQQLIKNDIAVADSRFVVNYFRLSQDNRMLFGGGETYSYQFPDDIAALVQRPMLKLYPQLENTRIDYAWGGTLAITMSRLPHIRRIGASVLSASGYSGSGVAMATMAGKILAETIYGNSAKFDVMSKLPTPDFPGGPRLRLPLLALALTWYRLRDLL